MKITIEKFGALTKRVTFEPRALTVFCGNNNTGKTYALYVLNALMDSRFVASFDWAKRHAKILLENRTLVVPCNDWLDESGLREAQTAIGTSLKHTLSRFFVADAVLTEESVFEVSLDAKRIEVSLDAFTFEVDFATASHANPQAPRLSCRFLPWVQAFEIKVDGNGLHKEHVEQALNQLLMTLYCPFRLGRALLLPAERSGINLFFRELNSRRAALLRHVTSPTLDTNELLKDIIVSRYPQPIHDYIEFMNAQPEIKRQASPEFSDLAAWLQKEVLRVKYKVDRYGDISISPLRSKTELGLHLGSSTAKTFFGLWSYLNHLARRGDCLMIDEPELNLHPQNQRAIARLLAELVNRGIRVVVSTHSDYIVREWGNLLMLSQNFEGRDALAKKHGLPPTQWLQPNQVAAYEFEVGGVSAMAISGESGIRTRLFDDSIDQINAAAQEVFFAKQIDNEHTEALKDTASVTSNKKSAKGVP